MAIIPFYLRRPEAILRIPEAIARGLSAEGFIRELKSVGASYRRTLMLSDWRSVANIVTRADLFKYVRKDRLPTMRVVADVEWELSSEYMYKCKVWSRLREGEPLTERFVNLMSDKPLTPTEIEQQVYARWGEWERYSAEELKEVRVWAAYHKIEPIESVD